MATVFTKIIDGELPGTFVWRDEHCVAFMSINPLKPGHTLVVPRAEIDHWLDAPAPLQAHLFAVAAKVGEAQMTAFSPARIGLVIAGFEVPHLHLHVVPVDQLADMDFAAAPPMASPDELAGPAAAIRAALGDDA